MPNGHSGGFLIDTDVLKRLLRAQPDGAAIGKLAGGPSPGTLRPVNAVEVLRMVEESPLQTIAVEEQDHSFYIVHVSDEPVLFVAVASTSPLFAALASQHSQAKRDMSSS